MAVSSNRIDRFDRHLDADTLSAFAEHALSANGEAAVFAHLAVCATCRDYVAVNAELKDFQWSVRAPKTSISRSIGVAAGIAGALAALLFFFLRLAPAPILSLKPYTADSSITLKRERSDSKTREVNVPRERLATNDYLAARNSHRFLKEVNLASVSFAGVDHAALGVNQIVLKTKLGERWITVEGFGIDSCRARRASSPHTR